VAGATLVVGVTVVVYLKAKPCRRGYTTVYYQEKGPVPSSPSMMVTGRD